jgi:hypothetical protein
MILGSDPLNDWLPIVAIIISISSMFLTVISTVIVMYGRLSRIENDVKWICRWLRVVYKPKNKSDR